MSTHFQLTHGLGVYDMHSGRATCDLTSELIRRHPNWFALSSVKQVHSLSWACLSQKFQKCCNLFKCLFFIFLSL